ncbi:MAG: hypothetical protein A2096_07255 [Spirochaetes bacterium GWF1_41_5]|nr:MAG: hypothetical protein A2096_07255 [Spirochaetes bacterium GWF1_41_5]
MKNLPVNDLFKKCRTFLAENRDKLQAYAGVIAEEAGNSLKKAAYSRAAEFLEKILYPLLPVKISMQDSLAEKCLVIDENALAGLIIKNIELPGNVSISKIKILIDNIISFSLNVHFLFIKYQILQLIKITRCEINRDAAEIGFCLYTKPVIRAKKKLFILFSPLVYFLYTAAFKKKLKTEFIQDQVKDSFVIDLKNTVLKQLFASDINSLLKTVIPVAGNKPVFHYFRISGVRSKAEKLLFGFAFSL